MRDTRRTEDETEVIFLQILSSVVFGVDHTTFGWLAITYTWMPLQQPNSKGTVSVLIRTNIMFLP